MTKRNKNMKRSATRDMNKAVRPRHGVQDGPPSTRLIPAMENIPESTSSPLFTGVQIPLYRNVALLLKER